MIQRSETGVYRLPLCRGWAVGVDFMWPWPLWKLSHPFGGGWCFRLLWLHIGRAPRRAWTHWGQEEE